LLAEEAVAEEEEGADISGSSVECNLEILKEVNRVKRREKGGEKREKGGEKRGEERRGEERKEGRERRRDGQRGKRREMIRGEEISGKKSGN
jgi:hypothetical protein